MFFLFDILLLVGFFPFDVLSVDDFYSQRFLLRRFVGESITVYMYAWLSLSTISQKFVFP
jgi:hypothetical protein